MQLFKTFLGAIALASTALASASNPLYFTSAPTNVEEQTPVTFEWKAPSDSAVTITLMKGPTHNLKPVRVITSSATGGSFTWTPPNNLVSGTDYAFQIQQGNNINWWGPVVLNASLEPGSPTPVTSTIMPPPPPTMTSIPPPPANSTMPSPPPFSGAASIRVPAACGLTLVAVLALAL